MSSRSRTSAVAPDRLAAWLTHRFPDAKGFQVAFSGGLDSHVLLHALASVRHSLPAALGTVHVDHGLHPDSAEWAAFCASSADQLAIPFHCLSLHMQPAPGASLEAEARDARYQALAGWLPDRMVLLTAHHQRDQAETLLLQLFRGAGPKGLAAMPASKAFGAGWLARPLLDVPYTALREYADQQDLDWIDDPSNAQWRHDRNLLRQDWMPRLRERWPGLDQVLARAAGHQAAAARLLDQLACQDLEGAAGGRPHTLSVQSLLALDTDRRRNLLRHVISQHDLPVPSEAVLARLDVDVLFSRPDAEPRVAWPGGEARRYRDDLFMHAPLPPVDAAISLPLTVDDAMVLTAGTRLRCNPASGAGVARRHLDAGNWQVRYRQGGEQLRPAGDAHTRSLKHLLQEAGVPPWERERLPLIYRDSSLVAVAGMWIAEGFQADPDEPGIRFIVETD